MSINKNATKLTVEDATQRIKHLYKLLNKEDRDLTDDEIYHYIDDMEQFIEEEESKKNKPDPYAQFKNAKIKERKLSHRNISAALNGVTPKTAQLIFNLGDKNKNKLDINKNAAIKAMELVSDLLLKFGLPSKPVLEYQGIIKNAMSDGMLSDGIVRIGAKLRTLMGHTAYIDIPVIIRNKSILEPAIFFFNESPYVMCAPALDELIKRGSLLKELQPRRIYSGPLNDKESTIDKPRTPIINLPHMFSPGIRNPWTFKRYSQTEKAEPWTPDLPQQCLDQAERDRSDLITVGSEVILDKDYKSLNRGGGTITIPSGEKGIVVRDEKGDGMCLYVDFKDIGLKDVIPYDMLKKASSVDQIKDLIKDMLREGYQKIDIRAMIHDKYPEYADEALSGLEKTAFPALMPGLQDAKIEKKQEFQDLVNLILDQIKQKKNTGFNDVDVATFINDQYGSTNPKETEQALALAKQQAVLSA